MLLVLPFCRLSDWLGIGVGNVVDSSSNLGQVVIVVGRTHGCGVDLSCVLLGVVCCLGGMAFVFGVHSGWVLLWWLCALVV